MIDAPHENYKVLAKSATRRIYAHALIGGISESQWVTSNNKIISFSIDRGTQSGGMSIGNAYCAKLTMKLIDVQIVPGDTIQVSNSFKFVSGGRVSDLYLGFFIVQNVSKKGKVITITAYDNMIRQSKDYKSMLTYPATLEAVLDEVRGNMVLDPSISIPHYVVIEKPVKGESRDGKTLYYTKRQMLGFIASLLGGNFYLNGSTNTLFLTNYSAAPESMAAANTINADFSGVSYQVTDVVYNEDGVSVTRDDETDASGVLEFECPLKLGTAPSAIANTIKAALGSVRYEGGTLTRQGYGLYELGDLVTAYDAEDTAHTILISGIKQKFENGSFTEKFYSCAESSEEQNYSSGDITGQTVPQSIADQGISNLPLTEYTTAIAFRSGGFDLTFVSGGKTYTNEFTVTEDSAGNITKITNETAGRKIVVTYDG